MQEIANCHFLIRVWADNGKVCCEEDFIHLFEPSLILELKENRRPIEDWFLESFSEALLDDPKSYLPEKVEICGEPILVEVIGAVNVNANYDSYYGEYDEELEQMEAMIRLADAPAKDKAVTIDAIHALLETA